MKTNINNSIVCFIDGITWSTLGNMSFFEWPVMRVFGNIWCETIWLWFLRVKVFHIYLCLIFIYIISVQHTSGIMDNVLKL